MVKGNSFYTHWCANWQWSTADMECAGKGTNVCSLGERLKESEYVTTIFQWQQICIMLICLLVLFVAKFTYRLPYCFLLNQANVEAALDDESTESRKNKKRKGSERQPSCVSGVQSGRQVDEREQHSGRTQFCWVRCCFDDGLDGLHR